jgi:hypothetical protein
VTPSATVQVTSTDISSVTTTVESTLVITDTVLTTIVSTITIDNTISTTVTAIATITDTCIASGAQPTTFVLQASGAGVDGQFISLSGTPDETVQSTSFTPDALNAARFTINGSGNLYNVPYGANTDPYSAGPAEVFFDEPGVFGNVIYLTCSTTGPLSGPLSCTGYSGTTIFQLCPSGYTTGAEPGSGLSIGTTLYSVCQAISFTAIPSCS